MLKDYGEVCLDRRLTFIWQVSYIYIELELSYKSQKMAATIYIGTCCVRTVELLLVSPSANI